MAEIEMNAIVYVGAMCGTGPLTTDAVKREGEGEKHPEGKLSGRLPISKLRPVVESPLPHSL
jgi:hypothetical protein